MKLCSGFHNHFESKQTTVALQQFVVCCQEEFNSLTFAKTSRLGSHAHCGLQSFISCAEAFRDGAEILQGYRPAIYERDRGSKKVKATTKKHETAINNQFMHAKHTRI